MKELHEDYEDLLVDIAEAKQKDMKYNHAISRILMYFTVHHIGAGRKDMSFKDHLLDVLQHLPAKSNLRWTLVHIATKMNLIENKMKKTFRLTLADFSELSQLFKQAEQECRKLGKK